ncbi:MAG: MarR family transcriptional regulator [Treponema sp.]|nr:MarR family transcriptional regulator [Treponema sp.]
MAEQALDNEVTSLMTAIGRLTRRVRAAVSSRDLSWTQTAVMARLDKEGPATASDLARAEGMKPQSMGSVVASLEELGLIARRPHPTDGRRTIVELTKKGAGLRKIASDEKRTWLAQAVAQLDARDRKTLFAANEIIRRLLETDRAEE